MRNSILIHFVSFFIFDETAKVNFTLDDTHDRERYYSVRETTNS